MTEETNPSEQRGGTTPDAAEAREKGEWVRAADEGVVPTDLGGSDAPRDMLDEDPELESSVLGRATASSSSRGRSTGCASRATSGSSAWRRRAVTRRSGSR
jgi:hypothetical protein